MAQNQQFLFKSDIMDEFPATRISESLKVAIVDQQRVFADALVYRLQMRST